MSFPASGRSHRHVGALADRVGHIFTVNEISCFTDLSHVEGSLAPGLNLDRKARNQVRHRRVE